MIKDRPKYAEYTQDNMDDISLYDYRYIQPKYDGIWGRLVIDDGVWTIFSRTGKVKKTGVYKQRDLCQRIQLIGEYINNANHPIHANQRFFTFDCIEWEGVKCHDLVYKSRHARLRNVLEELIPRMKSNGMFLEKNILRAPTYDMRSSAQEPKDLWRHYVEQEGFEGLVFKMNKPYHHPKANIRIKQKVEIEYMCIGFDMADPESKYAGQVGAVRGSLFDKPCDVKCGGLTEDMRLEYTNNPQKYIGQVFTAKGNGWFPSGSVRHPKFSKWREDKTLTECSYSQIPESIRAS